MYESARENSRKSVSEAEDASAAVSLPSFRVRVELGERVGEPGEKVSSWAGVRLGGRWELLVRGETVFARRSHKIFQRRRIGEG